MLERNKRIGALDYNSSPTDYHGVNDCIKDFFDFGRNSIRNTLLLLIKENLY